MTEPKCIICGEDAPDQNYWVWFFGRTLVFCPLDHGLLKQLFRNGQGIQSALRTAGINIGVPPQKPHEKRDTQ